MEVIELFKTLTAMGLSPTAALFLGLLWRIERRITVLEIRTQVL